MERRPSSSTAGSGSRDGNAGALLDTVAAGGRRFERLVTTRNRRVMISVGDGGRTLRIHEVLVHAPADVLHAIGAFFSARSTSKRSRARRAIQTYLDTVSPALVTTPRRRRRAEPRPADLPYLTDLAEEFHRVNRAFFASALPEVPIRLSGRMRRRNGHFATDPLEIAISRSLCSDAAEGEARHTLRHEMIHLWQWVHGRKVDHGAEFRRWARILDVHPRAARTVCWSRAGTD